MLPPTDPQIAEHFEDLEQLSKSEDGQTVENFRSVDLRYVGQGYEISVDWDGDATERFHREHERRYGYADRSRRVEAVTVRLRSVLPSESPAVCERQKQGGDGRQAVLAEKQIHTDGDWRPGLIYDREKLRAGDVFGGPAIVTEYSATTFVPPGCRAELDGFLNIVIDVCPN
jgi:N-methylhydantoinase A